MCRRGWGDLSGEGSVTSELVRLGRGIVDVKQGASSRRTAERVCDIEANVWRTEWGGKERGNRESQRILERTGVRNAKGRGRR